MEYYQLKYFAAVARTMNFQNAADELFVSRQAVSKAINQLEDELGYPLFLRSKAGVVLTEAGRYFSSRSQELVDQMEQLEKDMLQRKKEHRLIVRLCYSDTIFHLLEQPLQKFASIHHETCELDLLGASEKECKILIDKGNADLSLTTAVNPGHSCVIVASYPICLLMSESYPLAACETISPKDLKDQVFLAYGSGTDEPFYLPEHIRLEPSNHCIISNDLIYLFRCVQEGRGILMSVEENMGGLLEGVIHIPYPPAGTWNHYLTISGKGESSAQMRKIYLELSDHLRRELRKPSAGQ